MVCWLAMSRSSQYNLGGALGVTQAALLGDKSMTVTFSVLVKPCGPKPH